MNGTSLPAYLVLRETSISRLVSAHLIFEREITVAGFSFRGEGSIRTVVISLLDDAGG